MAKNGLPGGCTPPFLSCSPPLWCEQPQAVQQCVLLLCFTWAHDKHGQLSLAAIKWCFLLTKREAVA